VPLWAFRQARGVIITLLPLAPFLSVQNRDYWLYNADFCGSTWFARALVARLEGEPSKVTNSRGWSFERLIFKTGRSIWERHKAPLSAPSVSDTRLRWHAFRKGIRVPLLTWGQDRPLDSALPTTANIYNVMLPRLGVLSCVHGAFCRRRRFLPSDWSVSLMCDVILLPHSIELISIKCDCAGASKFYSKFCRVPGEARNIVEWHADFREYIQLIYIYIYIYIYISQYIYILNNCDYNCV